MRGTEDRKVSDDTGSNKGVSVSMPIGAVAAAAALGLAAAAYAFFGRDDEETPATNGVQKSRPSKGVRRKLGLMTLVTLIENDATRKVLVALLRAMARRA